MQTLITTLGNYERSGGVVEGTFFGGLHETHVFSEISDDIKEEARKIPNNVYEDKEKKKYKHFETPNTTDDIELFNHFGRITPTGVVPILVTVADLIKKLFKGEGPLQIVKDLGQQNLNVGLLPVMHKGLHIVYLECLEVEPGSTFFNFHLHTSNFPRDYKPGRQHLWLT